MLLLTERVLIKKPGPLFSQVGRNHNDIARSYERSGETVLTNKFCSHVLSLPTGKNGSGSAVALSWRHANIPSRSSGSDCFRIDGFRSIVDGREIYFVFTGLCSFEMYLMDAMIYCTNDVQKEWIDFLRTRVCRTLM